MATSPSITPFFTAPYSFSTPTPTTAPMYARTTYLPPPPFVFAAPVSGSPPIPPPPTFPYAAAAGFFQPQHTAHPPFPCPLVHPPPSPTPCYSTRPFFPEPTCGYSTAPATFSSPCSQAPPSTWPPPAPNTHPSSGVELPTRTVQNQRPTAAPPPGCYYTTACPYAASNTDPERAPLPDPAPAPTREPHRPLQLAPSSAPVLDPSATRAPASSATPANAVQRHAAPSTTSSGRLPDFTMGDDNGGATFQIEKCGNTTTTAAHVARQVFAEMPTPISWQETHAASTPALFESAEAQARAEATISKDVSRAVLDLEHRLEAQMARDRTSFDTIKGELEKLTAMASQLAVSIGKRSTSAHKSTPTASASSASFLAPHVFGEMPTTIFLQETHGTGPVHHNPTQSTSVGVFANPGAAASLVTPLNPASVTPVQSTFVADENNNLTEQHPYEEDCFTKSEQQPQHASSIGFCTVLPTNLIIQQDREGKQKTEDTSNYFTKTIFSPERAAVCSGSVFSLKIEEIICDSEKMNDSDNQFLAKQHRDQLLHCSSTAPQCSTYEEKCQGDENILWVKSVCQPSTGNSISFYQWDPGASTPLHSSKFGTYVQQPRDPSWNAVIVPERRTEWDPGDTKFQTLVLTTADATKRQRTYVYKFGLTQILAVQFGVRRHSISIFPWDPGATEFPFQFMTSAGATELHGTNIFKSEFTCSCETQTPKLLNFLVNLKKIIPWPSGKFQLITPFKLFMELLCANPAIQVIQQLHHLEFLVMAELSLKVNKVDGQLTCKHKVSCCLQIILAWPYSVPACYSSMFSSAEAIHSARSMSAAPTMCVLLVLSSDETAEEGKDAANVYTVSEIQLPMRKTSHACYPDGESILYSYKGLHVHKTQLLDCTSTATHACYSVPAHTPPTQISTQACSNTELVRTNFEQNPYSTPKFNGSKAAYSSQIFQKCKAMNSHLYWHEDIKFIGIALWLIHFHPP